ncbi:MAG TPA: hypothetical protein VHD15_10395 [Hyphomicrobiales bacterium]|nr:hypothetical protein [Hyphomicrobiales bacterium]
MDWRGLAGCGVVAAALGMGTVAAQAVTFTSDARLTLDEFARAHGENPARLEARYAATGMIRCNGVYSTGQLTLRDDIVTTAAHAFYDPAGRPRGDLSACTFMVEVGGLRRTVPLDASTLVVGTTDPYPLPPSLDWAVVRLAQPIAGVHPYTIANGGSDGEGVALLAHRHRGWVHDGRRAIEDCRIRSEAAKPVGLAPREIDIDCSAGDGASGSAILEQGADTRMVGIYVGWRSSHPETTGPYGPDHVNFGIAVEGHFRDAVLAAVQAEDRARQPVPVAAAKPTVVNAAASAGTATATVAAVAR